MTVHSATRTQHFLEHSETIPKPELKLISLLRRYPIPIITVMLLITVQDTAATGREMLTQHASTAMVMQNTSLRHLEDLHTSVEAE